MIKLRLKFANEDGREFDIVDGERLNDAVTRALDGVPSGTLKHEELWQVVLNGHVIEGEFWPTIKLSTGDRILISPKIRGGDAGQLFKTAALIVIAVVATVYLGPEAGAPFWTQIGAGLAVAAVTIGATLLLNALIPPPVASIGEIGGLGGTIDSSQMYSISGQSNNVNRLGTVPSVYGNFRMFPNVAAIPYTELAVDPDTGETIQYLYAIYDFGMGTYQISELKIGDTPLTTDSFEDFQINFVDPAKPLTNQDQFDQGLQTQFQYYKGHREITSLSLNLDNPGDQNIQTSDGNPDGEAQEIVLDFVCGKGLFGFSSNGDLGTRNVLLSVEFAPHGTSDWRAYNDLSVVDSYQVVGGQEITEFNSGFIITINTEGGTDDYYQGVRTGYGIFNSVISMYVKPGTNKLLLEPDVYAIGSKVWYGNRLLGLVQSVDETTAAPNFIVTLDRVITNSFQDIFCYQWQDFGIGFSNVQSIRVGSQDSAAFTITGKSTSPVYGSLRFKPTSVGQYDVRITRIKAFGDFTTQTQDSVTWGAITTAYLTNPMNTDKRHMFMELKIRATDQLNGNVSTLSGVCQSIIPVYDPDTETWSRQPTSNPAWIFADLLTGQVNKRAIPQSRLDLPSLLEWAAYCDEIPTAPPGQTFTQPRFTCNFVLDFATTLQDLLAQVGGSSQASLNIIGSNYGVLIDKFRDTPVQIFTPRNSRDFASTRSYTVRPDGVSITFVDPTADWNTSETTAYDNGFNPTTAVNLDALTAFGCTNNEQAWRFGRYMIAQNRLRQETITILVDFEYIACTRGDFVQITQDVMQAGGVPARVKAVSGNHVTIDDSLDIDPDISYGYVYRSAEGVLNTSTLTATAPNEFDLDGDIPAVGDIFVVGAVGQIVLDCIVKAISPNDDTSATLTLVEKADDIFDYESTSELPDYSPQISRLTLPDVKPPGPVTNLVVTDNTWRCSLLRTGLDYFVTLTWDIPVGSVYEQFEIWVNDGRGYRSVDSTKSKTYQYIVDQTRMDLTYGFKVAAVSATGKKLELVAMTEVTALVSTKPIPPSDVSNFNVTITDQVLQLSWDKIADCDAFQYVLRYSPDVNASQWASSTPLAIVQSAFNTFSCQARTGSYFIKAIDYAGNQSANASIAITTIPNLFGINDVDIINEAPDFVGEKDQTVLVGDSIFLVEQVPGDVNSVIYYAQGFYTFEDLLDLGDIYTVRLISLIRADGFKKGETMHDWVHLHDIAHLNTTTHDEWNVTTQYRATTEFNSMSDWEHLSDVDHIDFGSGGGFTDWRDIPMSGDVTGRLFQFRIRLDSFVANVTPRLYDTTVESIMPDRVETVNNIMSDAIDSTVVTYSVGFAGPTPSPAVQISIDSAQTGDYWSFDTKTLDGFSIRFFDKNGVQVARQFDAVAQGFGHKFSAAI